jgi:DNA recombination protein RmuC
MLYALIAIIGVVIGIAVMFLIMRNNRKIPSNEDINTSLATLSREALRQNSQDFLVLAKETLASQTQTGIGELDTKKRLIDQTLESIKGDLQKVERMVMDAESKREKSFGEISSNLKLAAEQTIRLQDTTSKLQTALASTKIRGQWGERMAEDVLRFAGFIEGINYQKQQTQESVQTRPDYTFLLPHNSKVNMDVKFPLDNNMKYLNEDNEVVRETYKQQFLKDTRQRVKEVNTREYINPAENTVDYVLIFIPNEQIYCFINESDNTIIDEALKHKVILCSPLTLYAILAVIRQAMDSFNIQRTTASTLALFGNFYKQWEAFKESMDNMGKHIDKTRDEYQKLVTTRINTLEKPLHQIEDLRKQEGIGDSSLLGQDGLTSEKNNQ